MKNDEKTQYFLKNLVFIALFTIFAMVSSRYMVQYYMSNNDSIQNVIEYSSNKAFSQEN